jgi:tellurite resistance protein
MFASFSAQDALLAAMMLTAAADGAVTPDERLAIAAQAARLPAFDGLDERRIADMGLVIAEVIQEEDGVDQVLRLMVETLPVTLRETAYALACDVAAADGEIALEEMRLLEMIRHELAIERLAAAAIERGARARHARP